MSVKITSLEIENVKKVKAVKLEPSENGLTIIGGKNGQGKTSVLDSIAWALGGDKYRPSKAQREGSVIPPNLHVSLSNGLIVERKGKNSDLRVTDPEGRRAGQQLLNEFVEQLALDLPKFMEASNKEKAETLLKIIGVGEELTELETAERNLYNDRTAIGRIADQKKKFADEMPFYDGVPSEIVSASELIKQQQYILARNGENQRKRERKEKYDRELAEAQTAFDRARERLREAEQNALIARKDALDLLDESTEELEKNIRDIDELNIKIRNNLDKEKAEEEAKYYAEKYDELTGRIYDVRKKRKALLDKADMPLDGLSVENGELIYKGCKWDCMSSSDQLKTAAAIVRKLKPDCGFVLMDKLEQMDSDTLSEFASWLEGEGLQVIATRVSTGGECTVIIEDGHIKDEYTEKPAERSEQRVWKAGEF